MWHTCTGVPALPPRLREVSGKRCGDAARPVRRKEEGGRWGLGACEEAWVEESRVEEAWAEKGTERRGRAVSERAHLRARLGRLLVTHRHGLHCLLWQVARFRHDCGIVGGLGTLLFGFRGTHPHWADQGNALGGGRVPGLPRESRKAWGHARPEGRGERQRCAQPTDRGRWWPQCGGTVFFPPLKTTCVTLSVSLFATLPPKISTFFAHAALLSLLALSLVSRKTMQAASAVLPRFSPIVRCLGGENLGMAVERAFSVRNPTHPARANSAGWCATTRGTQIAGPSASSRAN